MNDQTFIYHIQRLIIFFSFIALNYLKEETVIKKSSNQIKRCCLWMVKFLQKDCRHKIEMIE